VDAARFLHALVLAAERHRVQRRKDADATPYINHPIAVAAVLAHAGQVTDEAMLVAAILHDTVEDTPTSFEEIESRFGATVADLVRELTDDKSLPKQRRKQLQIEHAPSASAQAKQLKIADKICNVRDIDTKTPADWDMARRREYLNWAEAVVVGCRGVNLELDRAFDQAVAQARARLVAEV
jgi:guanosine-3',5'-bis(diphosphate) 3'-pyrophosphohydrolase